MSEPILAGDPADALVSISGNVSVPLDDPDRAWIVMTGRALVFAMDIGRAPGEHGETVMSARNLVLEAGEGDLLIGVDGSEVGRRWFVVGIAAATIRPVAVVAVMADAAAGSPMRDALQNWLDHTDLEHLSVDELLAAADPVAALGAYARRAAAAEVDEGGRRHLEHAARIEAAEAQVAAATETAVDALASVFDWRRFLSARLTDQQDDLIGACRIVGDRLGIAIQPPAAEDLAHTDPVTATARASKVRFRRVRLSADWWRQEGEPLVGELVSGGHVALLPGRRYRGYRMVDPASGRSTAVSDTEAAPLRPVAIAMIRPLPGRGPSIRSLLRFSLRGTRWDVLTTIAFATVLGVLALVPPLATQAVFGRIVPEGDSGRLIAVVAGLIGVGLAAALFEIARGIALLRTRVRLGNALQMALWDRMLRLPASFFRRYQVGDLAGRSLVVNAVNEQVTDVAVLALIGGAFGTFNLIAMFIISPPLAVVGLLLCVAGAAGLFWSRRSGSKMWVTMLSSGREVSAEVLQYFTGIVKIRTAGAESRVFARWAQRYAQQSVQALGTFRNDNIRVVFQASFRTTAVLVVFVAVYFIGRDSVSAAEFMGFYVAFGQLLFAFFQFSGSFATIVEAKPTLEQCRPILDTPSETDERRQHPGTLTGRIEVRNVRFRYPDTPKDLFDDLSLTIEPGEFVAVVGPSGSGKSSLMRLLLGFDMPDAGSILYDGVNLRDLDIDAVREQLGVVLQKTDLLPGSIYQNIAGSADLSADDVWAAARNAALDQDILRFPDGMDTDIGEGVGILSGGQRQRLQIARALAADPKLMFMDEATSALDNLTQSVVSRTVSALPITRVVIAHRLSTIAAADRVIVIDGGRVVQDGPFGELSEAPGPFAELIARQRL
ncbi:MAG TPA: NHLP bacteriocin export ABC transporter permease/ATPase subunit [Microbacterium sp.]|nr:NHLP bacteriocin export ABC transporter permease/ATPase subunit [Microbacterium sp.]